MLKEFKEFITGGNVIEFAVAVIMAGAIGAVVKGFVSNIVMPVVGLFTGGVSFADQKYILSNYKIIVSNDFRIRGGMTKYRNFLNEKVIIWLTFYFSCYILSELFIPL